MGPARQHQGVEHGVGCNALLPVLLLPPLVLQAGLKIERNRVRTKNSSLAMTRTLGDTKYKHNDLPPEAQVGKIGTL